MELFMLGDLPNMTSPGKNGTYSDPMRLWAHSFSPRNLKQLFRWTEYLYYNSAQIFAGVRKYAEYPITEIEYLTDSDKLTSLYRRLLEETVGIKQALIKSSIDLQVYGNSFTSVHLPFKRSLRCGKCNFTEKATEVEFKYNPHKAIFKHTCSDCGHVGESKVVDKLELSPEKINIVRWDPKLIQINYNTVTSESEYFLSVPSTMKSKVTSGDRHLILTLPMAILDTIASGDLFKFNKSELMHLKSHAPAGVESGWGYPPLVACMPLFYHASVLRKANEAIALERIVPMRVMHPQAISGNADPILSLSMSKFMGEVEDNLKKWRRDPNHIMMSPVAIGVSQVGGEGRALMVNAEIQQAEDNIINAMGFPKEFVYGGLSYTGSSVTLRMLENQLESSVFQINKLLTWLTNKMGGYLGWEKCKVKLGDFRMIDDVQQKQLVMQLFQMGMVSKTTMAEAHGINIQDERDKIKQENLTDARFQKELELDMMDLQKDLSQQARQMSAQQQGAGGLSYDQQAVISEAENLAMQLLQTDPSTRKSQLASLQSEDYVMYSVVIQRMEQLQLDQKNQAMQQAMGGGQPPM
jgi:hypothetical protein